MKTRATATFEGKTWEEEAYDERAGQPKLARARVTNRFQGEIEGDGALEYLMLYPATGPVHFIGLERIVGRIGNRSGSFVLQGIGTWEAGEARASLTVVPGSGTGDLHGLRGQGSFVARNDAPAPMTLDYDFE